jgi:hypothetical protein
MAIYTFWVDAKVEIFKFKFKFHRRTIAIVAAVVAAVVAAATTSTVGVVIVPIVVAPASVGVCTRAKAHNSVSAACSGWYSYFRCQFAHTCELHLLLIHEILKMCIEATASSPKFIGAEILQRIRNALWQEVNELTWVVA